MIFIAIISGTVFCAAIMVLLMWMIFKACDGDCISWVGQKDGFKGNGAGCDECETETDDGH